VDVIKLENGKQRSVLLFGDIFRNDAVILALMKDSIRDTIIIHKLCNCRIRHDLLHFIMEPLLYIFIDKMNVNEYVFSLKE
jgi:hypothetical protein